MIESLLSKTQTTTVIQLSPEELDGVLGSSEILREEKPALSGPIRVLDLEGRVLVQEQSSKGELLIRLVADRAAAEVFVNGRLDAYERMWDG